MAVTIKFQAPQEHLNEVAQFLRARARAYVGLNNMFGPREKIMQRQRNEAAARALDESADLLERGGL